MSNQARIDYRIRLGATVDCARFLLQQGLPFCGHDETEDSKNQGNFLELLQWLCVTTQLFRTKLRSLPNTNTRPFNIKF